MAKLSMAKRRALPKSDFLVPSKAPGAGSYPIPDAKHRAIAKGLAAMHGQSGIAAKADRAIRSHASRHHSQAGTMRVFGGKLG